MHCSTVVSFTAEKCSTAVWFTLIFFPILEAAVYYTFATRKLGVLGLIQKVRFWRIHAKSCNCRNFDKPDSLWSWPSVPHIPMHWWVLMWWPLLLLYFLALLISTATIFSIPSADKRSHKDTCMCTGFQPEQSMTHDPRVFKMFRNTCLLLVSYSD